MAASNVDPKVSKGGLWNTQPVSYSKETQDLLKAMMQESKLTMFQQKHIGQTLKSGKTLPLNVPPTHSYQKKTSPQPKKTATKIINASGCCSGLRTKDSMEKMGAFEKPDYKPRPQRCRTDKEKDKLGNIMAYGQDLPPPNKSLIIQRTLPKEDTYIDRFDELQQEIEERREFLNEMISLGHGNEYQLMMETEISQKVREMEIIDKERTEKLNKRIEDLKCQNETEGQVQQCLALNDARSVHC